MTRRPFGGILITPIQSRSLEFYASRWDDGKRVMVGEAEGDLMFAVVVQESGEAERVRGSRDHVEAKVVPQVRNAPGIVSATFTTDEGGRTLNLFVFQTEDAAQMAVEWIRGAPRPPFMRLETVELREVLAHF